jgi:hypothetical protein
VSHVALVLQGAMLGRAWADRSSAALAVTAIGATALTHAVFFGAGRYAMVCYPLLGLLAGLAFDSPGRAGDTRC